MKIIGSTGTPAPAVAAPAPAPRVEKAAQATAASGSGELQSAVLQPALAALKAMPEIDHAKVAALRDALARGEIPFDAGKLAGLIERHHGSKG